jgi:signal peptidase II
MNRVYSLISSLGLLVLVIDQWTKQIAINTFGIEGQSRAFLSWWKWTLVHNHGLAFGVFNDPQMDGSATLQRTLLSFLPFIVIGALWFFHIRKFNPKEIYRPLSMGLVLGGAMGNFIDRIRFGYVIDFIDWFYPSSSGKCLPLFYGFDTGTCHWPVFNVADAAVSVAIVLIALETFFIKIPPSKS